MEKVNLTGGTIEKFSNAVSQIKEWTMQTSDASGQTDATLSEISKTVTEVNHITEDNTKRAKNSLAASESLTKLSEDLMHSISFFKLK